MSPPQFEVVPFTFVSGSTTSTGYLIQMLLTSGQLTGSGPQIPDPTVQYLGYASYAAMISALGLAASINLPTYPYCYLVGAGAHAFSTDALAKAAAIADCNLIVAQRNTNVANSGINASNPFVTLGTPVLGPL
jgi:hypothetical protein